MKKIRFVLFCLGFLALVFVMGYSGYRVFEVNQRYLDEAEIHDLVMEYSPAEDTACGEETVNQDVINLQTVYADVAGWIKVDNTNIDYPFVWYADNDYYLRRDINGKKAWAGTIFMDWRCGRDFSAQNTVLYGHHMKNMSMFGSILSFDNKEFFESNTSGVIYLPYSTINIEFFAFMVINPKMEKEIYRTDLDDTYFEYIKEKARYYRDIGVKGDDKTVTLSTCSYEFNNARMVLVGRIDKKYKFAGEDVEDT